MLPQEHLRLVPIKHSVGAGRMMTPQDRMAIVALLREINAKTVVEFGVNEGFTARAVLDNVSSIESYIGIDVLPGYLTDLPQQRTEVPIDAGRCVKEDKRVKLIVSKNGSYDLKPEDIGTVDAAIIDGDHSERGVTHDTMFARMCVGAGGVIMWHDYFEGDLTGVKPTLEAMADEEGRKIVHVPNTWLAFERIGVARAA